MTAGGGGGGLWIPPEEGFERFAAEMSRPEKLEAAARRLFERLGVDPALRDVRFDPFAVGVALEAEADQGIGPGAPPEALAASRGRLVERLVTPELRSDIERALMRLSRGVQDLRDALSLQVALSFLAAEGEARARAADVPLWSAVLEASLVEWPLRAWIREKLVETARAKVAAGGSGPVGFGALAGALREALREPGAALLDLERFLAEDHRAGAVRGHVPALGAPRILRRWLIARDDLIPEVRLPFERVLHGASVEARLREKGESTVVSVVEGRAALPVEASRAWSAALAFDLPLVAEAYRARCLDWLGQALAARDEAHFEAAIGHILSLDTPDAAVEHVGLFANYEHGVREAASLAVSPAEQDAIEAVLAAPLDPAPYRAFVEVLRAGGEAERAAIASGAVAALFPAGG